MKEMLDRGIDAAKPNLTDAKMSEAYKNIAETSQRALLAEMNFTTDEYAKMVAEQSEIVTSQNNKIIELEEQLRQANIQLDLAKKAGFKGQGIVTVSSDASESEENEDGVDDADFA